MALNSNTIVAFFQWIRKILIVGFFLFLFIFSALIFGIQIPYIQTRLVDFTTKELAKVVNYPIKIGGIKITFTGGLVLEDVLIEDSRSLDMLSVKEIRASFRLISLFGRDIVLQKVTLYQPNVKLRYYKEVDDINFSDFIYSLQHIGEDSTEKAKVSPPHVGRYTNFIVKIVDLENAKFSFEDTDKQHIYDRFDFSKFSLDSIYMSVSKFKIVSDTVSFNVKNLRCIDEFSRMKVHKLDADFGICEHYMKLENLALDLGRSHVSNSIVFKYDGFGQLSDIEDSVMLELGLKNTRLDTRDVSVFFPELIGFYDIWGISGKMKGYFYDFKVDNFDVKVGNNSSAKGNAAFRGLPDVENMVMKFDIKESDIYMHDIKKYGLSENYNAIKPFGRSRLTGNFEGKYHDFHFEGNIDSEIGEISGDFGLKFDASDILKTSVYNGVLALQEFDLQPFGVPDWMKKISFDLKIDGKGFDILNSTFNASGFVNKVDLNGYTYKNSFLSMRYANKKGLATLDIKDSNIVADALFKADFNSDKNQIELDANIAKANIHRLGYYDKPLKIASEIKFKSAGLDASSLSFDMKAKNTVFSTPLLGAYLPELLANYSKSTSDKRLFKLKSDAADLQIDGNFELFSIAVALDSLRSKIAQSIDGGLKANEPIEISTKNLDAAFELKINQLNSILAIFSPELKLSAGSSFVGRLESKKGVSLNLMVDIDSIQWSNFLFTQNRLDFLIEKSADKRPLSAVFEAISQKQYIDGESATENFKITAGWKDNIIDFVANTKQQNEENNANLFGEFRVGNTEKILTFKQAELNFLNSNWNIHKENKIVFRPQFIGFEQVEMRSDTQLISIQGELSKNSDKNFKIILENFRMQNLDKIFNKKLEGSIEGYLTIQDFYSEPKINSNIRASNLKINKLYIGNISGKSHWDNQHKKIDLNMDIERFGNKMFSLHGNYTPNLANREERLNIVAILNKTNLVVFEPFIKDVLSDLKGDATGLITLRGNLTHPIINGEIDIDGGALKVNYLNTTYYFDEKITMNPSGFVLNNIVLDDHNGGLAVVEGGIFHKNFKEFKIRVEGQFKNMSLLNTTLKENDIYYGNAKATGNFSLKGNFNALDIQLKAKAQKGTKFYILYNAASNTEGQSFIKFSKSKKSIQGDKEIDSKTNDLKITADLDINITNDAYSEFVLDKNTGDKIAGFGEGQIRMAFDSDGEFSMNGDYTFSRDSYYLFTFLNVINKKFTIQPGSRVEWNGDPATGILNVTARYEDRIPLNPLVDSIYWNVSGIRTPYPVATILYVKGELQKPEISYDIKIYNYPSAIGSVPLFNYISAFENKIKNNVNEMNTQVFSLLVFRRFLYGTSGLEGAAGSTVSELLTNQLSQIVSELDKNLQVDLRMNGLDRGALNSVQVRISYELLDGKVRITRSGSVTNALSQATTSSIIGDISVEYMLTNDGKFRLKGFTRQNPNALSISSGSQGNSSTGGSILHTTSFNTLNPFDKKKKKKVGDKKIKK